MIASPAVWTPGALRRVLAGTQESGPRPMADLDLPAIVQRGLAPAMSLFRPAAVLVPVLQRPEGLTVLLTVRARHLRKHAGQISFPGGRRDDEDASLAACALREAQEEVGLDPASAEVIGYLPDYPTLTRFRVTPVVALVQPPAQFVPQASEVAEVFELPLDTALNPDAYARKALRKDGLNVPFFELQHGPHRVWGATAGMLWEFCRMAGRTPSATSAG